MKLTLQTLLDEGSGRLSEAGIEESILDAKYLLFEAFHTDMTHFIMNRNEELRDEDTVKRAVAVYRETIERRAMRIPLQQITGSRGFMGLDFYVNEHVLIPRQDTETLVEEVLKDCKGRDKTEMAVLDMCAGSGCIGLSLMVLGGFSHVTEADISREALKVVKMNAERLLETGWEDRLTLLESDLFSAFVRTRGFDMIVSNPPYIPTAVIEGLEPEVKDHEPRIALDGKEDGLYFYRRLAKESPMYLKPGGAVYFEIGFDQGEAVSALLSEAGFQDVCVIKDAPGHDRVVKGVLES